MSTVQIKYDGQDITGFCSIDESTFTTASTNPGPCRITFKDTRQRYRFIPGKTLELLIDGKREWDGYLISAGYNYWFGSHTADCEPCPHVTPRKLILNGVDRNILLFKRVLYNPEDPTSLEAPIWPAGTTDRTILIDAIDRFVDDLDGVDYTSMIEVVGSPDYWQEIRPNGPGATVYDLFRDIAKMTGAVFYIDPDRRLIYTDVETPNADFGLSDRPGSGEIGYRELLLLKDASKMVNDAMVWGAGQGSNNMVFSRVTDAASLLLHDRWQNPNGFYSNLWKQESADHIVNTIVYGSPQNKRGRKDDGVSVRCTVFEPGLRVGEKAVFESEVHAFTDVIPIREMTITFIDPETPKFELYLSHEFDEPWTTQEFWWPTNPPEKKEDPPERCWLPTTGEIDYGSPLGASTTTNDRPTSERQRSFVIQTNGIDTFNNTILTGKPAYWFDYFWQGTYHNVPGIEGYQAGNPMFTEWTLGGSGSVGGFSDWSQAGDRYQTYFADMGWYWGFPGLYYYHDGWIFQGERMWEWATQYWRMPTPKVSSVYQANPAFSKSHLGLRGTFRIELNASQQTRQGAGFVDEWHGGPSGNVPGLPHTAVMGWSLSPAPTEVWQPRTVMANLLGTYTLSPGESREVVIDTTVPANSSIHWGIALLDAETDMVGEARVQMQMTKAEWFPVRSQSLAYISDLDPNLECIPTYGAHCLEPKRGLDGTYSVGASYYTGSLRVYLDGVHLLPTEYTEQPSRGEFVFKTEPPAGSTVWACYEIGPTTHPVLPDTSITGSLFIRPVSGSITGLFGSQESLWPPAVWHGQYYPHFHNGVDFGVPVGTPVYAAAAGRVVYEDQYAGGTMIHIYHPFHGFRTTYAHLSSRVVANGAEVSQGQHIGYSGNTGQVTGAHLHWGLVYANSPEDPLPYTYTSIDDWSPPSLGHV